MDTYINIGNFIKFPTESNWTRLQSKVDAIAKYYDMENFDVEGAYMPVGQDVDMVVRVSDKLPRLQYASKVFYESEGWEYTVNIIPYDEWLSTRPPRYFPESGPDTSEKQNHYIYLLKDNLSFALMTMCGDVADDYITLMDYSDIKEVNVYTADFLLNSILSGFDMDKFYQIPVKDPENATINDVFDFLKKEK